MLNYLTSSLHVVDSSSLLSLVHDYDFTMTHRLFTKYLIDLAAQTGPRKDSLRKI